MIIKGIHIQKFRGFNDLRFSLGENLTVIAGQNGTQKTTLLGIITQPFTITDRKNPLYGERPLSGGNYKSLFSEKFKLSETFDKPNQHEWTLTLNNPAEPTFTVESIKRTSSQPDQIRFWKKGDRSKGSGYIQKPVIYLSLSRLFPIGEDESLGSSNEITLAKSEFDFFEKWHNYILITPGTQLTRVDYLSSSQKKTLGANTSYYDWKMNSAGQDNVGKILLAILSFKRLKENHTKEYQGGILAIDEIDATLYPGAQLKLIKALSKFSSELDIQVICTTHSLNILENACELQADQKRKGQVKVVYLEKSDDEVIAIEEVEIDTILHKLNLTLSESDKTKKTIVFTEDPEGRIFLKALLKSRVNKIQVPDGKLGCANLIQLASQKIPGFRKIDALVVLDGDVRNDVAQSKKVQTLPHFIVLPGKASVERLLAEFLSSLSDKDVLWKTINKNYSKQFVFQDYTLDQIRKDRDQAKRWFNSQMKYWGTNCVKVINPWIQRNRAEVDKFIQEFEEKLGKIISY